MMGPRGGAPFSLSAWTATYADHELRPCIETLTPWPWVSSEHRRVGNVLCDMYRPDDTPDLNCPRQLLKTQLKALREKHGLEIKTGFEYEFFAFKENTLEPLGSDSFQFCDLRVYGRHQELMNELREALETMGVKIATTQTEYGSGQWELTTDPYEGVAGADVGFYVKNAVKGFLETRGYHATFMTRPTLDSISCGLHLNHSLWRPGTATGGGRGEGEENVLLDVDSAGDGDSGLEKLSPTARHWIAGLLTHASALTALACPTLNCYRRLSGLTAPSTSTWGLEDRNALIRVRALRSGGLFLENRLPSAAASPYLALAATVAAGRDGLERRLQCPPPSGSSASGAGSELPRSLAQALTALEEDQQLVEMLGEDFVRCYVGSKREMEIGPYDQAELTTDVEQIEFERDMYFRTY